MKTLLFALLLSAPVLLASKPNIVLVMADDMGWGQTGYYNHPTLRTPHLDAMAASPHTVTFDRMYAARFARETEFWTVRLQMVSQGLFFW